jgi:hypothetical protein
VTARKRGTRRIVGYVVSHSGKRGGPWEASGNYPAGTSTDHKSKPPRGVWSEPSCKGWLKIIRAEYHPNAKAIPLVRYELDREEERLRDAVVEAAMTEYEAAFALSEAKRRYHEEAPCHAEEEARADAPCVAASTAYVAAYCARENATRALRAHLEKSK